MATRKTTSPAAARPEPSESPTTAQVFDELLRTLTKACMS